MQVSYTDLFGHAESLASGAVPVVNEDLVALPYEQRLARLQAHHIGLWDVIAGKETATLTVGGAQRGFGPGSAGQLTAEPIDSGPRPPFAGPRWRDADGRVWQEIDLPALAQHEQFLAIAN